MATSYNYDLLDAGQKVVKDSGVLTFTAATPSTPPALNQVSPVGTVTSGALATVQLVSTTGAQVSTTRDVETHTLITSDATNNIASCIVALSPDNVTYSTLATFSIAAAINTQGAIAQDVVVRVPAGWYIKLTTSHMAALPATTYY